MDMTEYINFSPSGYSYEICEKDSAEKALVEKLFYRGIEVKVYADDPGQQFYAIIEGQEYSFGAFNTNYLDDIFYIIDDKLDNIYRFDLPYYGAQLKYVYRKGYRDIVLSYRARELKTFILMNDYKLTKKDKEYLILRCKGILNEYIASKDDNKLLDL